MRRFFAAALLVVTCFVGVPAHAQDAPDNAAVAVNTKDGTDVFRLAFSLYRMVNANQPQPGNAAAAVSSCDQCSTTAIAIQIVLLMAPDSSPTNVAIAENVDCASCTTIALAYQLLFDVNSKVQLTPEGRKQIMDILAQIAALQDQNLTPDELRSQTDALVAQLATVIANELRPIGHQTNEQSQVTGSPSPSASSAPSGTESPPPLPTDTPTPTSSPSPTDTPTATP